MSQGTGRPDGDHSHQRLLPRAVRRLLDAAAFEIVTRLDTPALRERHQRDTERRRIRAEAYKDDRPPWAALWMLAAVGFFAFIAARFPSPTLATGAVLITGNAVALGLISLEPRARRWRPPSFPEGVKNSGPLSAMLALIAVASAWLGGVVFFVDISGPPRAPALLAGAALAGAAAGAGWWNLRGAPEAGLAINAARLCIRGSAVAASLMLVDAIAVRTAPDGADLWVDRGVLITAAAYGLWLTASGFWPSIKRIGGAVPEESGAGALGTDVRRLAARWRDARRAGRRAAPGWLSVSHFIALAFGTVLANKLIDIVRTGGLAEPFASSFGSDVNRVIFWSILSLFASAVSTAAWYRRGGVIRSRYTVPGLYLVAGAGFGLMSLAVGMSAGRGLVVLTVAQVIIGLSLPVMAVVTSRVFGQRADVGQLTQRFERVVLVTTHLVTFAIAFVVQVVSLKWAILVAGGLCVAEAVHLLVSRSAAMPNASTQRTPLRVLLRRPDVRQSLIGCVATYGALAVVYTIVVGRGSDLHLKPLALVALFSGPAIVAFLAALVVWRQAAARVSPNGLVLGGVGCMIAGAVLMLATPDVRGIPGVIVIATTVFALELGLVAANPVLQRWLLDRIPGEAKGDPTLKRLIYMELRLLATYLGGTLPTTSLGRYALVIGVLALAAMWGIVRSRWLRKETTLVGPASDAEVVLVTNALRGSNDGQTAVALRLGRGWIAFSMMPGYAVELYRLQPDDHVWSIAVSVVWRVLVPLPARVPLPKTRTVDFPGGVIAKASITAFAPAILSVVERHERGAQLPDAARDALLDIGHPVGDKDLVNRLSLPGLAGAPGSVLNTENVVARLRHSRDPDSQLRDVRLAVAQAARQLAFLHGVGIVTARPNSQLIRIEIDAELSDDELGKVRNLIPPQLDGEIHINDHTQRRQVIPPAAPVGD